MSPSTARDVILTLFSDAWVAAGQSLARVCWDDLPDSVPSGNDTWARVTIRHAEAPTRAFGDGVALYDNTGTVYVQVFTPIGDANVSAYDVAYSVVTAYRKARNEGVRFRNARLKEAGKSGAFEQTNVLTDFSYDD